VIDTAHSEAKTATDILINLYKVEIDQGRHHEVLRSNISSYINALSAALIAAVSFQNSIDKNDWPLGVLLIALGIFGVVTSLKHYERFRKHGDRAGTYRREILRINNLSDIDALKRQSDQKHRNEFRLSEKLRLYQLWIILFFFHIGVGLYVLTTALI
jgi:hypothetical protein